MGSRWPVPLGGRGVLWVAVLAATLAALAGLGSGRSTVPAPAASDRAGGEPVEVVELRSRMSRTVQQADGVLVTEAFAAPVHFRDGEGAWKPINTRLGRGQDGRYRNGANRFVAEVPGRGSEAVRVRSGSAWVSFGLEGARPVGAVAQERSVRFDGALEGADVEYVSEADGLKELIHLAGPGSPSRFVFDLSASDGLVPRVARDGGLVISDGEGREAFRVPAPVMWDSASPAAVSRELAFSVQRAGGGWRVVLEADREWLGDEEREWPVTVDPTVTVAGAARDCYIVSADPNGTYCPAPWLLVGRHSSGQVDRSLLRFDLSSIRRDAVVLGADLELKNLWGPARQLAAHEVTRSWDVMTTWNRAKVGEPWSSAGGDYRAAAAATTTTANGAAAEHWYLADLAQDWVSGRKANDGVLLKTVDESQVGVLEFDSSTGSTPPVLRVAWESRTGLMGQYTYDTHQLSDRADLAINVATGGGVIRERDVEIDGVGIDLKVERFKPLNSWAAGAFGSWWVMGTSRDVYLQSYDDGESIAFHGPNAITVRFARNADGSYRTPAGVNATLEKHASTGKYTLTYHRSREKLKFRADGLLERHEDRNGHGLDFTYTTPSPGRTPPAKIIDSVRGRELTFTANNQGRITKIADGTGREWLYGYEAVGSDPSRRLVTYTNPAGDQTVYTYNAANQLIAVTDPRGNTTKLTWGSQNRITEIIRVTNPSTGTGPTTTYSYDDANRKVTITSPRGNATSDPNDGKTVYTYDFDYQVTKVTNALGQDAHTEYTPNGDADNYTDQAQGGSGVTPSVTDLDWDTAQSQGGDPASNNLTGGTGADGETFAVDYHQSGSDPLARYQAKRSRDSEGTSTWFSWDASGNLNQVADQEQGGSVPSAVKADLDYTTTAADPGVPKGLLKSATDGKNQTTRYEYNAKGEMTAVKPPLIGSIRPGELEFTYDSSSRVKTRKDEKGQTVTYTYDKLDRVTRIDASNGAFMTFAYDKNGNLTGRGGSSGTTSSSFGYDALNRRTTETIGGAPTITYDYDENSNLATLTDAWGTTTYGYDHTDRVTSIQDPTNAQVGVNYGDSANPRWQELTYPGGQKVRTETGLSGKPSLIEAKSSAGASLRKLTYAYRSTSHGPGFLRDQEQEHANGSLSKTTRYAYDALGRLCLATTGTISGAPTCSSGVNGGTTWRYQFDAASNRTKTTVGSTVTSYGYDAANRLCWSTTNAYSGNHGCAAPTGATSYPHDANGNRTGGGLTLGYDVYDRLTSINSHALAYAGADNQELIADGTTTLTNNLLGLASATTGSTTSRYLRSPEGHVIADRTATATRYVIPDALGSTRWLLNGNTVEKAYTYTPDGETTATGTGADTLIRFAGGHLVRNSLYHYGHRYYDPVTARWTQRDPLDQPSDLRQANAYLYAGADPVNLSDPDGDLVPALAVAYTASRIGLHVVGRMATRRVASQVAARGTTYKGGHLVERGVGSWRLRVIEQAGHPGGSHRYRHVQAHLFRRGGRSGGYVNWHSPAGYLSP